MILPYDANPGRMEFSERTGRRSAQRLFLARVTAALRAASRRFRVVAALRPAARRFRVNAPFWPGVSVTLGFVFMVSLSLNGGEPRAKLIEVDVVRMVRPATQLQPAIYRLATVFDNWAAFSSSLHLFRQVVLTEAFQRELRVSLGSLARIVVTNHL